AWSSGYSMPGVRAGSLPSVAVPNRSGAFGGALGSTTSPVRSTISSAAPVSGPHVALTGVLPPCGPTVTVASVNEPNAWQLANVQWAVIWVPALRDPPNP